MSTTTTHQDPPTLDELLALAFCFLRSVLIGPEYRLMDKFRAVSHIFRFYGYTKGPKKLKPPKPISASMPLMPTFAPGFVPPDTYNPTLPPHLRDKPLTPPSKESHPHHTTDSRQEPKPDSQLDSQQKPTPEPPKTEPSSSTSPTTQEKQNNSSIKNTNQSTPNASPSTSNKPKQTNPPQKPPPPEIILPTVTSPWLHNNPFAPYPTHDNIVTRAFTPDKFDFTLPDILLDTSWWNSS